MNYTNHQPVPVLSSDQQPIMPCHPARARKLLRNGRAVPQHVKGIFAIRLINRTRAESSVQEVALNIDPGSDTTGFAVVTDHDSGQRSVLAAVELKHRAKAIKATMTRRRQLRRNRRGRLRFRAPKFDHRRRKPGTLPPSVDSLRSDTLRVVSTLTRLYPIGSISIERNKFDPQLMMNPDIKGAEYQRGTLYGWQLRAYILGRDSNRCVYCGRSNVRLELDHVRPRTTGSDRVDNLVTCCRDCNASKSNQPIDSFLADQPELLKRITDRLQSSDLASAAHVNAALPAIVRDIRQLEFPVHLANAASVSWARHQLNVPKTHCYDAALQGTVFDTVTSLPSQVLVLRPNNGRSKQKANVNRHRTPVGRPFRQQQRLPKHLRQRKPAAGHSGTRQRHGPRLIATGDTIQLPYKEQLHTGRAVIKSAGKRVAIQGTKPQISAKTSLCHRIGRNPGWTIRRAPPSQQDHGRAETETLQ